MPADPSTPPNLARLPAILRPLTDAAWAAVRDATPPGWDVGRPSEHPERREWVMFAFDTHEQPVEGKRSCEWTAVGQTELHCVQTTAYCLRELGAGRWPK